MAFIGNTPTTQSSVASINYFNGDASTTAFTLPFTPTSVAQVQVAINNVSQNPATAFSISGNVITFTSAPPVGSSNIVVYYAASTTLSEGAGFIGAIGGDNTTQFYQNANTVTSSRTLPANTNLSSVGPLTIPAGVVVSVADTTVWKVI
jgi:hypothetical protein